MKPRLLTTLATALCTALLLTACNKSTAPTADVSAPVAATPATASETAATEGLPTFQDLKGKPITLADYAGKKVFVNYWATWCAPCIRELPSISRASDALKNDNVVFLLASDETLEKINDFLLDHTFTGNFVKLNGYVGGFGIDVQPTSVLYDEHGKQVKSWAGPYEWDSAEMLAQIRNPQ